MLRLTVFLFLIPLLAFTADNGILQKNDSDKFTQLIENESAIKDIYDQCIKQESSDLGACMDAGLNSLDDTERERIINTYFKSEQNEAKYESVELATIEKEQDPAIAKLQEYLRKRLEEALYGEAQAEGEKRGKTVDHAIFLKLYKNQISKNIIMALSAYCMDADANAGYIIYEDQCTDQECTCDNGEKNRTCTRKRNLASLATVTNKSIEAADTWQGCIANVQHVCHKTSAIQNNGEKGWSYKGAPSVAIIEIDATGATKTLSSQTHQAKDYEYSQQRACEVTSYLKELRQNLITLDQIANALKNETSNSPNHLPTTPRTRWRFLTSSKAEKAWMI